MGHLINAKDVAERRLVVDGVPRGVAAEHHAHRLLGPRVDDVATNDAPQMVRLRPESESHRGGNLPLAGVEAGAREAERFAEAGVLHTCAPESERCRNGRRR